MFKPVFKNLLSSDPWGNEMIFHGGDWDIAALGLPAESNGDCSDEVLSLLCIRHTDTVKKTEAGAPEAASLQAQSALYLPSLEFQAMIN